MNLGLLRPRSVSQVLGLVTGACSPQTPCGLPVSSPRYGLGPCPRLDSVPLRRSWIPAQAGHPGGSPPAGAGVPKGGAPGDRGERRASQLGRCPRLRSRAASGPRRRAECVRAIDLLFVLPDLPARVTPPSPRALSKPQPQILSQSHRPRAHSRLGGEGWAAPLRGFWGLEGGPQTPRGLRPAPRTAQQ